MPENTVRLHRVLRTRPEKLYRAFLDPEDQRTLEQLTNPASAWYVLNRPDLHVLSGMTLFVGSV